ncbi:MAG: type II toxin-antitoxin system RelE/ParE family toxin [Symploca sp. SIO2E6]|nr:type II toxin-antitoxin system RelE/ParE family toxin [Symploca sp. SIO2E6]
MKVVWTNTAIEHLQAIHDYIARNSTLYANRVIEQLLSRSQQIAEFPYSGRTVPEFQDKSIREVISRPYRIIYRIKANQIDVLAVVHSSQQF